MASGHVRPVSDERGVADYIGSFGMAYLLALVLIAVPIVMAGVWTVMANTRFLDLLISSGVIAYTDLDYGFIKGVPNLGDYLKSQEPIDWRLVVICFCIYLGFYLVKAGQFHSIARAYGLEGSFGRHARAFFYGLGLNRLLPYNAGDVGVACALQGQGEPRDRAASALYVQEMFVWFEISVFLFLGLVLTGWGMTVSQTLPALVFFGVLYYVTRKARSNRGPETERDRIGYARVVRALANDPWLLVKLGALSLFAFFLDDITPFVTSQAFSTHHVILNVPFLIIQAGVVSGYIASRVPVTPGGIGQFEFGFGTALVMGGVALPEAITIAILDGLIRHSSALILFLGVKIWHGVETDVRTVLDTFAGRAAGAPAKIR